MLSQATQADEVPQPEGRQLLHHFVRTDCAAGKVRRLNWISDLLVFG
jgi:hypothetical protein